MIRTFLLLLAALATVTTVQGYFYEPSFGLGLPFKGGMASAKRNNSLILYGGENGTLRYSNDMYQLTQSPSGFTWSVLGQTNRPPPSVYSQSIISSDGSSMMLLGGDRATTVNQILPLQMYQYNFASSSWNSWEGNNNTNSSAPGPVNRLSFSATYNNADTVYVYGGGVNETVLLGDFWAINVKAQPITFTKLPDLGAPRVGHSASLLSNGKIVIIGGVTVNPDKSVGLVTMDNIQVFDTKTNTWSQPIKATFNGPRPSTRSNFNAFVTSDDKIVIFGGDDGAPQRKRVYINQIAILDTKTWTWTTPAVNGIPPSRRSYASGAMLDDTHLTVGFGGAMNIYYDDINVFDLSSSSWLQSFSSDNDGSSGVSVGLIVGVVIAGVVLLIIIGLLLWKFWAYVRWLVVRIHSDIWKPRSGEPIWAETARIIFQVFFLFLFVVFMVFVIRQAVESPNVTQRIVEASPDVEVPDVRFCFDGYPTYPATNDARNPGVSCQTDNGFPCSSYVMPLNMNTFAPTFSDNLGAVQCYLFRAPESFRLTATSGANNGSRLLFTLYGDKTLTAGRVHVSMFPSKMDPNAKVYNINDGIISLLSDADVQLWVNNERNDLEATNVYTVEPFTYSAMSYEIADHRFLQPVGWNYVGFLPITNSTPEVATDFRQESPNPTYAATHEDLGLIAVFPTEYAIVTEREVKMYTLVNALGFVGGVFGLLIALQAWLFGYRPRSPWGVVHRWSVGDMKRSLLRGLQSNFKTSGAAGIPLVHPVHKRFSTHNVGSPISPISESEQQRIQHVEERMQVLEMLFKAYYVNDEVFRSLDNANKSTSTPTEKGHDAASDQYPLNQHR